MVSHEDVLVTKFASDDYDEMVILKDIEFFSTCEHHMLPFFGKIHIAYIPHGSVVGISKLARLVEVFARRLQIQEKLTTQIANSFMEIVDPLGCGVIGMGDSILEREMYTSFPSICASITLY